MKYFVREDMNNVFHRTEWQMFCMLTRCLLRQNAYVTFNFVLL